MKKKLRRLLVNFKILQSESNAIYRALNNDDEKKEFYNGRKDALEDVICEISELLNP